MDKIFTPLCLGVMLGLLGTPLFLSAAQPHCTLNAVATTAVCNDNGTPDDPTDDTFSFELTVTGGDPSDRWAVGIVTAFYGETVPVNGVPISGGPLVLLVTDVADPTCQTTVRVQAPDVCSDSCPIRAVANILSCNDNGTPNDPFDDFFSYELLVTGPSTGGEWTSRFGDGFYDVPLLFDSVPITSNRRWFVISDQLDPDCRTIVVVSPPPDCSGTCFLEANTSKLRCDDGGTPNDPSDDTFTFELLVTGFYSTGTWVSGIYSGNFGESQQLGPFPLSDGTVKLTIQDSADPACNASIIVQPPDICSASCSMFATADNIKCIENNPSTNQDDAFSYEITVYGPTVGGRWFARFLGGTYGSPVITQSPVRNGSQIFPIVDQFDPSCAVTLSIDPPDVCAQSCFINAQASNIECSDNGTPADPSDDTFTFDLRVFGLLTGASWQASGLSGNYNENIRLGPFPIADGSLEYNIQDIDDANCSTLIRIVPPPPCDNLCVLSVDASNFECDDNGTPNDRNDDLFICDITVTGANTGSGWNTVGFTGNYNETITVGPYPFVAGPQFIPIRDNDDPNCQTSIQVYPQLLCSENCSIAASIQSIACDDNGTPRDGTDDIFFFDLRVNGVNTSTTWTAAGLSGNYGETIRLGPYPISDGPFNLSIEDAADANCMVELLVVPPEACSGPCTLTASISELTCLDNQTPFDPTDDLFLFRLNVDGTNVGPNWRALGATAPYGQGVIRGNFAISDGPFTATIFDVNDSTCQTSLTVVPPPPCSDTCVITVRSNNIQCNDNGTPADPTDDTFTFDLSVRGGPTSTTWTAGNTTGNYGQTISFGPFPIALGTVDLLVTDDTDPDCQTSISINAPSNCSFPCELTAETSNLLCSDNGTPNDGSDDTFTFELTVMGNNTGVAWTSNLNAGNYNEAVLFGPFPIAGNQVVNVVLTDDADPTCQLSLAVRAPGTCSAVCPIEATASNITCDDNGTPNDLTDDTFSFDLRVTGLGLSGRWFTGGTVGDYGIPRRISGLVAGAGPQSIVIVDAFDPDCRTSLTIEPPAPCADACYLNATISNRRCNDNGTPNDPSDDVFNLDLTVTANNAGSGWISGPFSGEYNRPVTIGPFNISDGPFTMTVSDVDDPNCQTDFDTNVTNPCSGTCSIFAQPLNVFCDDNGTPDDPFDDTYGFELLIDGVFTSGQWQIFGGTRGNYGQSVILSGYPISRGPVTIFIQDGQAGGCSTVARIAPPAPCSDPCSIQALVDNVLCDDNGTPSDGSDDTFSFELLVTGVNTGASWESGTLSGAYGQRVLAGPYPISGGVVELTIVDVADVLCRTIVRVGAPASCSDACEIRALVDNVLCDDNGTPSDGSDDTFSFELLVTGVNTGATWESGTLSGAYGQRVLAGPYPISGGVVELTIVDVADVSCRTIVRVGAPASCSDACEIRALVDNVLCDDNGTPSDGSDDTFSFELLVTGVNTGASWESGTLSGAYGQRVLAGPYPISGGVVELTIVDVADASCRAIVRVGAPASCSDACEIRALVDNVLCDDNGTPSDGSDDTFSFELLVTGVNTGATWESGTLSGAYGQRVLAGPYPISGGVVELTIVDVADGACRTIVRVGAPASCSDACEIRALVDNVLCDDNGTPSDGSDDTFSFELLVTGVNTGASWESGTLSGAYGQRVLAGPYPISGGVVELTIVDVAD
ncbi:MAG: hypothetical protein AAF990_23005, partial [Bacteroidota bacterium]